MKERRNNAKRGLLCLLAGALRLAAGNLVVAARPAAAPPDAEPLPFVSPIFGDSMVLQRGKPNTIWGWSQPGDTVRVEIGDNSATATAGADGRWQAQIQPPPPGGPYTVKITRPADGRAARRAGRRRLDLRGPVEHAVRPGPGQKRRGGDQERQSSRDPLLRGRPARVLLARGRPARHVEGRLAKPRSAEVGGISAVGLLLRPQGAGVSARADRPDTGRGGRRSGRDLGQRRSRCVR